MHSERHAHHQCGSAVLSTWPFQGRDAAVLGSGEVTSGWGQSLFQTNSVSTVLKKKRKSILNIDVDTLSNYQDLIFHFGISCDSASKSSFCLTEVFSVCSCHTNVSLKDWSVFKLGKKVCKECTQSVRLLPERCIVRSEYELVSVSSCDACLEQRKLFKGKYS